MANFELRNERMISGLHLAAFFGLERFVTKAFKRAKQIDINACTARGETVLHWAAMHRQHEFISMLVEKDAKLNTKSLNGRTALYIVAANEDFDSLKALLTSSQKLDLNIAGNHLAWTPLHFAAARGQVCMVEKLLSAGAKVDAYDNQGDTPLKLAVERGHARIIELLVNSDASVELRSTSGEVWSLLRVATAEGREDLVKLLIEKYGDSDFLNATDADGKTALRLAIEYERGMVAWLLLEAGADIDKTDEESRTPLYRAAEKGQLIMIWFLFAKKASIRSSSRDRMSPLHGAAFKGQSLAISLLLQIGADPIEGDYHSRTALYFAIVGGHAKATELLLQKQSRLLHMRDDEDRVALHHAAAQGDLRIVEILVAHGADMNARDCGGNTAWELAREGQHQAVANFLSSRTASCARFGVTVGDECF